ncbi:DNA translocase FtsK [Pararhodobacter zhoushanensis]|uniref:DNA translocase FtsK n=1 Tax=Pararhodobacter zhoushanensis TaxID=2479545 RepID=UPI000F8E5658|nr:DNA translocase FtsK [Pararhodobacter zhoushanensis]
MASYPSPQREPLLDRRLQAVLNQRGKELLGLCLIGLGLILALVLGSYSPEDPSWMAATDAPVHNALGRVGAALAAPLVTITGKGAWGLALALGVWGLRLVIHQGEENIMGRSLFVPVAIAMGSVWLASLVVGPGWSQNFGLGGMFGDTVLAAVMTTLPMTTTVANIVTLLSFAAAVALYLYVLGSSVSELIRIAQFLLSGLILTYAGLLSVLGLSARGVGGLAARGHDQWQSRRETRAQARAAAEHALTQYQPWEEPAAPVWHAPEPQRAPLRAQRHATPDPRGYGHPAEPQVSARRAAPPSDWQPDPYAAYDDEPDYTPDYAPYDDRPARAAQHAAPRRAEAPAYSAEPPQSWSQPDRQGVLGRVASLGRRPEAPQQPPARQTRTDWAMPEGELIEPHLSDPAQQAERPSPEGLRARIAELMTSRTRAKPVLRFDPEAYPSKRAKPAAQEPVQQAEPPLTGGRREPVLTGPAEPAPMGYAFSHAFGYQPAPAPAAYPGAFAPETARAPVRAASPAPSQDVLIDDDQDDYDDYDDRYDAPPPRAGLDPETRPAPSASMARRTPVPSRRAQAEAQPVLPFEPPSDGFELPPLALLRDPRLEQRQVVSQDALDQNSRMLESVLEDYGVRGDIVDARPGPVVTQYELEPAPGLKASRVIGLSDDIARSMSALSARVSTVPGRSVIGIELPNAHRETVVLREILSTRDFGDSTMRLPLALGKDIAGDPVVANLAKMPHLLIAGTTGSGKSVAINTMILSLLYKLTPAECRLIMIDPKMLELSIYDGIPHLLSPVVTDPKKAVVALKWVVGEMEERYRKMSKTGVRNIEGYNGRVREALAKGEMFKRTVQTGFDDETGDPVFETEEFAPEVLPFIVVIVDEMADLMMVAGKEIEACIQRLAQMARASGIHLIMATQRPSVDVITGTIKANFPTRISFQVTSKIDSRTILGEQGAEQLLGQGDMLYMAGGSKLTRVHGPFVSDAEVEEIVAHLKSYGEPDYVNSVLDGPDSEREADIDAVLGLGDSGGEDALYDQAVAIVARDRKCSTSYIQRKLGIGYNKAARLVEQMEDEGVVSTANHVGKREILVPEAH